MSDEPFDLDAPDDLTVDVVTVDRLVRQLAAAPETVTGIIAAVDDLPAGASTRTHAEWRSLAPLDRTIDIDAASPDGVPRGAVLRRRGAARDGGLLRVDAGAVAHRRSIAAAPDESAEAEGRSPFPWRPIVLFLALGDPRDEPLAGPDEVLGRLLEGLLDAEVEARLATPATGTAVRRHRPCAPTAATVEQLAPDVVVALDPAALEVAPGWCTRRATVVVDMTGTEGAGIDLVPWRIGTHPGRLRARVARSVEPADLARLVNRLASGPQPAPPRPGPALADTGDTVVGVTIGPAAGRRIAVVGPAGAPLLDTLADRAAAAGHRIERNPVDAEGADVAFVAGEALRGAAGLVAERAAAGRPTVAVIEEGREIDPGDRDGLPEGLVAVSTDVAVIDRVREAGVPGLRVPTMTTTARYQALRLAADLPVTPSGDVIGWTILRPGNGPRPDDVRVADALVDLIGACPDLTVEVDADPAAVPEALRERTEVTLLRGRPDPGELARHRVHLLTAPTGTSSTALLSVMLASAHVGVPTLVTAETARTVGGLADPRLVVPAASDDGRASSQGWADLLRGLLDGPDGRRDRDGRSARARACAEALDAPAATDLVISRLLGWLDRGVRGVTSDPAAAGERPLVSVVVPVYAGLEDVERCLASVIRHAATTTAPFELVVIDDASPDPAVTALVAATALAEHPFPVTVVHNEENRGFVASVNIGFEAARGDVVVLNADTVVTEGWLDRLADAARGEDVATVTPLTNSGSICTLPDSIVDTFALDGEQPRIDECGELLARHGAGVRPEVITGVGFCMYVTRAALDLCGRFDEETFGRGYGEEVDFCLRATRLGLRHLVEDSTFVYHRGGVSFADERDDRLRAASRLLHRRYRYFREANRREQASEPLAVSFAALDLGLTERDPTRPHVLHLLHGPPTDTGGTEKHLLALLEALGAELDFSILYPVESGFVLTTWWNRGGVDPIRCDFLLPGTVRTVTADHDEGAAEALATALDLFDVDAVHIHNVKGQSLAPFAVLADFDGPVVCSVHDLYLACPHYSLLYLDTEPCGIPDDLSFCARCFAETEERTLADLERFRARVVAGAGRVDRWVLPSRSAADYLLRALPVDPDRLEVIEHGSTVDPTRDRWLDTGLILDEPLRLAFVGRGWAKKGLRTVDHLADRVVGSDIEVHHFGPLSDDASPNVRTHGAFDNQLLGDLLHRAGIQIVLLPGAYAETFGLVMSEAIVAGIPVIGASYGALGERIRARRAGWTIDPAEPDVADQLVDLVERLDANRDEVLRVTRRVHEISLDTVAATAPLYAALYRRDHDPRGTT